MFLDIFSLGKLENTIVTEELKQKLTEKDEELEDIRENTKFLEDQISELTEQLIDAEAKLKSPKFHLAYIFQEGFEWYDVDELTRENRVAYSRNAELLLRNPVFKNEINFLIANLTKDGFLNASDFNKLELKRAIALGYADLKTRIQSVILPEVEEQKLDKGEEFEAT